MIADYGESEHERARQTDISVIMRIKILQVLRAGGGGTCLQHKVLPRVHGIPKRGNSMTRGVCQLQLALRIEVQDQIH